MEAGFKCFYIVFTNAKHHIPATRSLGKRYRLYVLCLICPPKCEGLTNATKNISNCLLRSASFGARAVPMVLRQLMEKYGHRFCKKDSSRALWPEILKHPSRELKDILSEARALETSEYRAHDIEDTVSNHSNVHKTNSYKHRNKSDHKPQFIHKPDPLPTSATKCQVVGLHFIQLDLRSVGMETIYH